MWLLLTVAWGAELEGLDKWQLVTPPAQPAWVVGSGQVWLRDGADCLPVKVDDAARGLLAAETCRQDNVFCESVIDVAEGLAVRSDRCTQIVKKKPGAVQSAARENVTSFTRASADDQSVQYLPVKQLAAWSLENKQQVATCDKKSSKAVRKDPAAFPDVAEGQRRCNVSARIGVDLQVKGGPVELTKETLPDLVDCTVPCEPNTLQQQLTDANAKLQKEWYAEAGATGPRLYSSADACKAATDTPALLTRDACANAKFTP